MILVIGGTGRIGAGLVDQLVQARTPARMLVRDPARARAGLEAVRGDLDDTESLSPAMAGIRSVFLLTTQSPRQLTQEQAVIAAARAAGVAHVVKVSASDAATRPDSASPVGQMHARSEAGLKASGMAWTLLRPSAFMQVALAPAWRQAAATGSFQFPLGGGRVAFVDVADIARAGAWALTNPDASAGRTLSITGPEALGLSDLAVRFAGALGRPVKAASPPRWLSRIILGRRIADPFLRRHQLALLDLMRAGGLGTVSPDLETVTGRPARSVADWLAEQDANA